MNKIVKNILKLIPTKKIILFESHSDFCDNTRVLFDYMIEHQYNKEYKMVWFVEYPDDFKSMNIPNVVFVKFKPKSIIKKIQFIYYSILARYAFFSHRQPVIKLDRGEKFINLWHGTGPKNPSFLNLGAGFDYVLYCGDLFKDGFVNYLSCKPEQLLPFGSLRNDLLFKESSTLSKLTSCEFDKAIMWMPTFRKNKNGHIEFDSSEVYKFGIPIIRDDEQLERLNNELITKKLLLVIKLHPAQDMTGINLHTLSNIVFLTNEMLDKHGIQPYSLLSEMDGLLTDYSSVYVDYLLLNRPIGFTVDDFQQYKTGFFFENILDYMPGTHINEFNDLIQFLDDIYCGNDLYSDDRLKVSKLMNKYQEGPFVQRFIEWVDV